MHSEKLESRYSDDFFLTNSFFLHAPAADISVHNITFSIILKVGSRNDQAVSHILILLFGIALHYALAVLIGTRQ